MPGDVIVVRSEDNYGFYLTPEDYSHRLFSSKPALVISVPEEQSNSRNWEMCCVLHEFGLGWIEYIYVEQYRLNTGEQ